MRSPGMRLRAVLSPSPRPTAASKECAWPGASCCQREHGVCELSQTKETTMRTRLMHRLVGVLTLTFVAFTSGRSQRCSRHPVLQLHPGRRVRHLGRRWSLCRLRWPTESVRGLHNSAVQRRQRRHRQHKAIPDHRDDGDALRKAVEHLVRDAGVVPGHRWHHNLSAVAELTRLAVTSCWKGASNARTRDPPSRRLDGVAESDAPLPCRCCSDAAPIADRRDQSPPLFTWTQSVLIADRTNLRASAGSLCLRCQIHKTSSRRSGMAQTHAREVTRGRMLSRHAAR